MATTFISPVNFDNLKHNSKYINILYNVIEKKSSQGEKLKEGEDYAKCIEYTTEMIKFMDNMNIFENHRYASEIKIVYYIHSSIMFRTVGLDTTKKTLTQNEKGVYFICIVHAKKILNVDPMHKQAMEMYKMIMIYLTIYTEDLSESISMFNSILLVDPCDFQVQYNMGLVYQRNNDLENALRHFKLAIGILDLKIKSEPESKQAFERYKIKCLNSVGNAYLSIQDRDLAKFYFYKAYDILPDDPDINNQLGVVFTELRITDKAIEHYEKGIRNVDKAHISDNKNILLGNMHMNMGLAYCYEINYIKAIESYNTALKYNPKLSLAYQNKLLDLNYISHMIDDDMYIAKCHKNINKIYDLVECDYRKSIPDYQINKVVMKMKTKNDISKKRLRIGFVSGDFICHPVSYFMNSIYKYINYDLFDVYCYSMKIADITRQFPKINMKCVKGTTPQKLKSIIVNDKIDILFDLSSQTGDNRLDTFALKPAPIQISYCGYPNTSGLKNMDYHIVDRYTDTKSNQKYYSEKLVFMDHCFLTYTPSIGIDNLPVITEQPFKKNGYLTVGSFNRYNKINSRVLKTWKRMMEECPDVRFVIKTKEFLTEKIRKQFLESWGDDETIKNRITILDYSDTYQQHLVDYNKIDIALDSFPYSGTTTSAEALMMGVPVITLKDVKRCYHSQNVTSSLMINSKMPEFVTETEEEYIDKIKWYSKNTPFNLKETARNNFLNGEVCNYKRFVSEFEDKLINIYINHKAFNNS